MEFRFGVELFTARVADAALLVPHTNRNHASERKSCPRTASVLLRQRLTRSQYSRAAGQGWVTDTPRIGPVPVRKLSGVEWLYPDR
jgi:hypothetical protein